MTVIKQYNAVSEEWETILIGEPGPQGEQGTIGATGPPGPQGAGIQVMGYWFGTDNPFPAAPAVGDIWIIGTPIPTLAPNRHSDDSPAQDGDAMVWDITEEWFNTGPIVGPPGPAGGDGAVPSGGTTGQVMAKASNTSFDTEWVDPGAGGGITEEEAVDAVAAALTEGTGIDIVYDDGAGTITVTADKSEMGLVKSDVGLGNVDNTADADKPVSTAQAAADALKADKTTTISTTAPLTGGGDLSANRTLAVSTFSDVASGIVPLSGGGTVNFLRADGTWAPSVAGGGALYQFTFNSTTTSPPTGSQLRFNNSTMASVTAVYVMYSTSDGIDTRQRLLLAAVPGSKLYVQDKDNSSQYQVFVVNGAVTDNTTWASIPVAFVSGGSALTSGQACLAGFVFNSTTASDTQSGVVELATSAETITGTDTTRAVTPAGGTAAFAPRYLSLNAQTGTTYTLVLTDDGKLVTLTNASAITLTVPTNASVAFPTGTVVNLYQGGAGQVTVSSSATVRSTPGAKIRAQYGMASLVKIATDEWILTGDLSA